MIPDGIRASRITTKPNIWLVQKICQMRNIFGGIEAISKESMNARQRRKYERYAKCAHRVQLDTLLTDDPYEIYQYEDYCKRGIYGSEEIEDCKCDGCKNFALSRESMRCATNKRRSIKKEIRIAKRLGYF